ncbi:hypothetical protein GH714_035130 [Hevea brasiliensis]|uniref:Non-haem dioxygenase N-terminal domain-containing protein n=1 Tax=Hevea brasiliensis TaxID=3981 RepID=A0A6A6KHA2_HEVBR|nr:hypothetical protein GH714_035130 [Hevea brasiliensis]
MSTLSEVYTQYPLKVDDIIPLDFDSVVTVPDSHAWPISDGFESNDWLSIPTIDLKDPDTAKLIGHACETWGVFQVVNHDIPLNLLDEVESEARQLFSLTTTQKLKALRSPGGVTGYGLARISSFFNKFMWHEGFTIIVYTQYPLKVDDIIPLDFDSVVTVPDSHAWPISDGFESNDWLSIPTIDLRDPDAAKLIGHACETWGVFQVVNHDIPLNLLDEVESEARQLFSLTTTQKLKALRSPGGVTGYGLARISSFFNKFMWHEGFTIIGSPLYHARELWSNDYQKFW